MKHLNGHGSRASVENKSQIPFGCDPPEGYHFSTLLSSFFVPDFLLFLTFPPTLKKLPSKEQVRHRRQLRLAQGTIFLAISQV